ncbi:DNA-3-methyladenine glycosylase I [Pseudoxanthomonas dokdonensis]|uniref:DNA-3-methyladenine glycosylase n=1 Tax=Pseudoxanthomonas dokdonensis TaxID=344882 RepID=A0A0R0CHR2_9GAMM|nr:DNA-3-methyladenine glycosylase I [Pseudoxanthomonas dokdonensis]KRG68939.1 DNA-3-methyladenine glycosylase [Pseudoxanthomonas dokdonensis]
MSRCFWAANVPDFYQHYHDVEWGVPEFDERHMFEMQILEGAQAGLSWQTILAKRDNYRRAFDNFDPDRIARYDEKKVQELMLDAGIVRNQLKIRATINNAQALLRLRDSAPRPQLALSDFYWKHVDGKPVQNRLRSRADVLATTPVSDQLSKSLKKAGFKFVGSTIVYAHMQACGMVNDHTVDCDRHAPVRRLGEALA